TAHRVELGVEGAGVPRDEAGLGGEPQGKLDATAELIAAARAPERDVPAALQIDLLIIPGAAEDTAVLLTTDRHRRPRDGERQPDAGIARETQAQRGTRAVIAGKGTAQVGGGVAVPDLLQTPGGVDPGVPRAEEREPDLVLEAALALAAQVADGVAPA